MFDVRTSYTMSNVETSIEFNFILHFFLLFFFFCFVCYLLFRYSLEISKGIDFTNGILFRIGTMNANATRQKVDLVLRALYDALKATSNYIAPQTKVYY